MGKAAKRKQERRQESQMVAIQEGLIRVSFSFAGKFYVEEHQLTASEVKQMKEMCANEGEAAANSILWQSSVWGAGRLAQKCVAKAGHEYAREHYKEPEKVATVEDIEAAVKEQLK